MDKFKRQVFKTIETCLFRCPGCDEIHSIRTKGPGAWEFNGDYENPTISPSILVRPVNETDRHTKRCHSFIKNGEIQFLNDCAHHLKGQTVILPNW